MPDKICKICGRSVGSQGSGMHHKRCAGEQEEKQRTAVFFAAHPGRIPANHPIDSSPGFREAHFPSATLDPEPTGAAEDWGDYEAHQVDPDMEGWPTEGEETNPTLDAWNGAPYCSRSYTPAVNDILVEHHPSIMAPNHVMSLDSYLRSQREESTPPPPMKQPWAPFQSRIDFDVANFALQARLNRNLTNALLQLVQRITKGETVSFKSYNSICELWERASHMSTLFEKQDLAASFKPASGEVTYNLSCYVRDTWSWTQDLLGDPLVKHRFHWDAQRLYRWTGRGWERFVSSPWTADRFWDIQTELPKGGKPLAYIIYSDKTRLSSFGSAMGYPVVARIANIEDGVRNSNINVGGGRVIGWINVIPDDIKYKKLEGFVRLKRVAWQSQMEMILGSVKEQSSFGTAFRLMPHYKLHLWPCIPISSSDYEEQGFYTLTKGPKSLYPCPVCLVPKEKQSDHSQDWPGRTTESMRALYESGDQNAMMQAGIRDVENFFWNLDRSDPYLACSYDRLHAAIRLFHHLLLELQARVKRFGPSARSKVDEQIAAFPRWSGLPHFQRVMGVQFTDGTKEEAIAKQVGFCALNVLSREADPNGWLLLRCVHAFRQFNMYTALTQHTTETIRKGQLAAMELSELIQQYSKAAEAESWQGDDKRTSWCFPKAHTYKHAFDDIMNKGVAHNYTTKINENMHGPLKKSYQLQSNFRDFAPQILRLDHCAYVASIINQRIDHYDQREALSKSSPLAPQEARTLINSSESIDEGTDKGTDDDAGGLAIEDEPSEPTLDVGLTMLVPAQTWSFKALEEEHDSDAAFRQFRLRFQRYLPDFLARYTDKRLPSSHRCGEEDQVIQEYRLIKSFYQSLVGWEVRCDFIRAHPDFFRNKRYDAVLINFGGRNIFTCLFFLFKCEVQSEDYEFTLIQPYDAPAGSKQVVEWDMGLYRVRAQLRKESQFVPAHTIIRGAVLVEKYGQSFGTEDYFVMDDIDEDMFIQMQTLY
ncbi:hypothetical protein PQX77_020441 [Marasmius sp. AFHP31]|nr:hypothetical protein PQX77_020441 [Marasmius sp. AFHP31]